MSDLRDKVNSKKIPKTKPSGQSVDGLDFTSDREAGKTLARRKLQAFHEGMEEVLSEARSFMSSQYSQSSFILPEAAPQKKLPPSKEATDSFMALLYGYEDDEITQN